MKIELRNIKHAKFSSQETECFSATVFLDGVRTGTVDNDGRGASNSYHPWSMSETLNDYARTKPPMQYRGQTYPHDADTVIGEILEEALSRKALRQLMSKRILFVREGKIFQTAVMPKERLLNADLHATLGGIILNMLPEAEALKHYRGL